MTNCPSSVTCIDLKLFLIAKLCTALNEPFHSYIVSSITYRKTHCFVVKTHRYTPNNCERDFYAQFKLILFWTLVTKGFIPPKVTSVKTICYCYCYCYFTSVQDRWLDRPHHPKGKFVFTSSCSDTDTSSGKCCRYHRKCWYWYRRKRQPCYFLAVRNSTHLLSDQLI